MIIILIFSSSLLPKDFWIVVVVVVVVVVVEIPVDEAEQCTSGESRSMTFSFIKLTNMICVNYS